jgi:hypothetical protein
MKTPNAVIKDIGKGNKAAITSPIPHVNPNPLQLIDDKVLGIDVVILHRFSHHAIL